MRTVGKEEWACVNAGGWWTRPEPFPNETIPRLRIPKTHRTRQLNYFDHLCLVLCKLYIWWTVDCNPDFVQHLSVICFRHADELRGHGALYSKTCSFFLIVFQREVLFLWSSAFTGNQTVTFIFLSFHCSVHPPAPSCSDQSVEVITSQYQAPSIVFQTLAERLDLFWRSRSMLDVRFPFKKERETPADFVSTAIC